MSDLSTEATTSSGILPSYEEICGFLGIEQVNPDDEIHLRERVALHGLLNMWQVTHSFGEAYEDCADEAMLDDLGAQIATQAVHVRAEDRLVKIRPF